MGEISIQDKGSLVQQLIQEHEHEHPRESVLVFGGGNFGTCLADHLAYLEHDVLLYARDPGTALSINDSRRNPKYLSDVELSANLKATSELSRDIVQAHGTLLFSIPTQNMRQFLNSIKEWIKPEQLLLFVNKGLEVETLMLPSKVIVDVLGPEIGNQAVFLSGPSFAQEIVLREVTCVVVASENHNRAIQAQKLFHAPFFRVYVSDDPIGVEISGALKNVIALASGVCHGLGLQMNARAALVTRGLAELTTLGVRLGGKPTTFLGLAGVGDLLLTASSPKSRNFTVGFRLGKGEKLAEIIDSLGSTAEGVRTTKAAYALFKAKGIESPIVEEMYNVMYADKSIELALKDLLWREASVEFKFSRPSFSADPDDSA